MVCKESVSPRRGLGRTDYQGGSGRWGKITVAAGLAQPKAVALAPRRLPLVLEVSKRPVVRIDPSDGRVILIAGNLPVGLVTHPRRWLAASQCRPQV